MDKTAKIYVAGHTGLVGSAVVRALKAKEYSNLLLRTHEELELTDQTAVADFFAHEKPDYVFLAAARVGGIQANMSKPGQFIYENLMIQSNVIHAAYLHSVKKLLFLSSACIYPRDCPQPMREEYLLTGKFEPSNEAYAIAKIAGMNLCASYNRQYGTQYFGVIPINLYGMNDNFDPSASHVIPALMKRFHEAKLKGDKEVVAWGTGSPVREFMDADDCADACLFLMERYSPTPEEIQSGNVFFNIGNGVGTKIKALTELMKEVVGFEGAITWDTTKPDGMPKKTLDPRRMSAMGWKPSIELREGLKRIYQWYVGTQRE